MATLEEEYEKKHKKKQALIEKREEFITFFLSQYSFFYIPQTEVFVEYTDEYKIIHEDTILHLICSLLDKSLCLPNKNYFYFIETYQREFIFTDN